jgi:signal transduction histidine kinase/ligand-binding sensor domain-containing protein
MRMISKRMTNHGIAGHLSQSQDTVDTSTKNILTKSDLLCLCLFTSISMLVQICYAQEQPAIFNRVVLPYGNFGNVRSITQDKQGYMWFTTPNGLHRYDGYHDEHYGADPSNPNSPVSNTLECMYTDKKGFIWIGTKGFGLDRLDPVTGIFKHYHHLASDISSLGQDTVSAITEDHNGILWVGTSWGLDRFDQQSGKFTHYRYSKNDPSSLSNNHVRIVYEDRQGTLWVGTGDAHFLDPGVVQGEGGLNKLNRETMKFTRYLHDPKDQHSLIDNRVRAIFEDSHGTFWVGTAGDGLHTMDRANGIFERHLYDASHPERLSRPALKKDLPAIDDYITFITEDVKGTIWIGTIEGGINCFNPVTSKITYYEITYSAPGNDPGIKFTDKSGWSVFSSNDGVLWISTWEGNLFRIDPYFKKIPYTFLNKQVYCVYQESDTERWIGNSTGLIRRNLQKGTQKEYSHDSTNPESVSHNIVNLIRKAEDGKLWVGTNSGLDKLDPQKGIFTHYIFDPENINVIEKDNVNGICEDKENVWLGTMNGVFGIKKGTGKVTSYQHDSKDSNSLSQNLVTWLYEDHNQKLWVGTWKLGGLNLLDPRTGKCKRYLVNKNISSIYEDKNNTIWIGSNDGLFFINDKSDSCIMFTDPNKEVKIANVLYITEDGQKNLWVTTQSTIFKLNPQKDLMNIFDLNFGVKYTGYGYSDFSRGPHGEMFFPDQSGYYSFLPEEMTTSPVSPQIIISGIHVGGQSAKPGDNLALQLPVSGEKEIHLNHDQNIISIDFTPIHYSDPDNNKTLYMLKNYDDTWHETGRNRQAYYFDVPPGKYIFRVRAASRYNVWAEQDLTIVISPPWWRTWWGYCLFIISGLGLIYAIYRNRINRIYAQQQKQMHTMVATQEEERKRISRDLHDDVGTKLSALQLFISSMKNNIRARDFEQADELAENANQLINQTMKDVREMLLSLSPTVLEEFGYITAVEGLINKINSAHLVQFNLGIFGMEVLLSKDQELALYRITQELINNILKHADATLVSLEIGHRDKKVILMIEDNGKGFDTSAHSEGYGIKNLYARTKLLNGEIHIDSAPGKGTSVLIEIPHQF